jgi:hypothetical protein
MKTNMRRTRTIGSYLTNKKRNSKMRSYWSMKNLRNSKRN